MGRGRWRLTGSGPVIAVVNVTAALLLLPMLVAATDFDSRARDAVLADEYPEAYGGAGLMYQGAPVSNLFVYDAEGSLLTDVQLFDQEGRVIDADEGTSCEGYDSCDEIDGWLPRSRSDGSQAQNIYPLIPMVPSDNRDADGNPVYAPGDPRRPFASVDPVLEAPAKDGLRREAKTKKSDPE